eukprot:6909312-Prymnesium_polylepis.2
MMMKDITLLNDIKEYVENAVRPHVNIIVVGRLISTDIHWLKPLRGFGKAVAKYVVNVCSKIWSPKKAVTFPFAKQAATFSVSVHRGVCFSVSPPPFL